MKTLLTTLILLSASIAPAFAAEEITALVPSIHCGGCARAIKSKVSADSAVASVEVGVKTKKVKVTLKEGASLDDESLTKLIKGAGYKVEKIERH